MPGPKPDYRVLAHDDDTDYLVYVGSAWIMKGRDGRDDYISVQLNARPWGEWDGKLQLHRVEGRSE